jgi:hypothetical protein
VRHATGDYSYSLWRCSSSRCDSQTINRQFYLVRARRSTRGLTVVGATDAILSGESPDISLPVRRRRGRSGKFAPDPLRRGILTMPILGAQAHSQPASGTLRREASPSRSHDCRADFPIISIEKNVTLIRHAGAATFSHPRVEEKGTTQQLNCRLHLLMPACLS